MKNLNIKVLGSGCPTCQALYNRVSKVIKEIDPMQDVEYITDVTKIVELGIMSSPVLIIDGQVISASKKLSEDEIREAIQSKIA